MSGGSGFHGHRGGFGNGSTSFAIPNGEFILDFSPGGDNDGRDFADASGDGDFSQFADLDETLEKHPLFKTEYDKVLDEFLAV
jgi:hypothetical protein